MPPKGTSLSTSSIRPIFPRFVIATRPWSFSAALSPLMITFSVMFLTQNLNPWKALIFTLSIISLQSGANLLNSYFDFKRGLDTKETAGDRTIVDGLVTLEEFPYLFSSVSLLWFVAFVVSLPPTACVLYKYVSIYGMGLILAVAYSAGSRPLKYLGLGDLTVFMAFGPLLVIAAAWACAQDPFNLNLPRLILFSIPAAFLVVAILHANNHRDIKDDAKSLAHTVAVRMGQRLSLMYYEFLVVAPPIISVIMALVWKEYFGMLAGGLTLPLGLRLALTARSKVLPRDIDAETAKLMLLYGLVTSLGIAVVG